MKIKLFEESDSLSWDKFSFQSYQGTFLHTRKFLSHHGSKFEDFSLVISDDNLEMVGIFPAAISLTDSRVIVSHPGLTYGGILHGGMLVGKNMVDTFEKICSYYSSFGFQKLIYKRVPRIYQKVPADDDFYAIFKKNGVLNACGLSSSIDLRSRLDTSNRRKRGLKKAIKNSVTISEDAKYIGEFWSLLEENLELKYSAKPVHSLKEISGLINLFPQNIRLMTAFYNNEIVAGVVLFDTPCCLHSQYIASTSKGRIINALDLVFEEAINIAIVSEKKWFDFGTSNENGGLILNENLYKFKSEFGGGGVLYESYEILL